MVASLTNRLASPLRAGWRAYRTKGWMKPFRNATPLLAGRVGQGVLSLIAVALATQTLGAELFGILVLITSFRQIVITFTKLRARDTIVKFGAAALQDGDLPRLHRLLRFGVAVDVASAAAAVTVILAFAAVFSEALNLPPAYRDAARLFGVSAAFALLANTPDGVLRLFDRFDLVAGQNVLMPAVQTLGALVLYATGAGLPAFLAVWFLATAISRLWIIAMGLRELRRQTIGWPGRPRWRDLRRPEAGVWHFTTGTYLVDALSSGQRHAALLMIGGILDPAAAAILHIARQIGTMTSRPLNKILTPALFPELARLTAAKARKKRRKMATRTGLLAAGLAGLATLMLVVFGRDVLRLVFGADFAVAYVPMLIFAGTGIVTILLHPVRPLLASMGRVYLMVVSRAVNIIVWAGAFWLLVPVHGPTGAALAHLIAIPAAYAVLLAVTWNALFQGDTPKAK